MSDISIKFRIYPILIFFLFLWRRWSLNSRRSWFSRWCQFPGWSSLSRSRFSRWRSKFSWRIYLFRNILSSWCNRYRQNLICFYAFIFNYYFWFLNNTCLHLYTHLFNVKWMLHFLFKYLYFFVLYGLIHHT